MNNYALFLSMRRKQLGLSQTQLANILGYTAQMISSWERGQSLPAMQCWEDLCRVLDIDINSLINCGATNNHYDYTFNDNNFAIGLKRARISAGLTQIELAEQLGVNNKTISAWENSTSLPTLDLFVSLTKILNLSNVELFYGVIEEKPKNTVKKPFKKKSIFIASGIVGALMAVSALVIGITIPQSIKTKTEPHIVFPTDTISLEVCENYILQPDYYPKSATVKYTSFDEDVALVDSGGLISPKTYGELVVRVYLEEYPEASIDLNVVINDSDPYISFDESSLFLETGGLEYLNPQFYPKSGTVSFVSSDPSVAYISDSLIVGARFGTATITAYLSNYSNNDSQPSQVSCELTVHVSKTIL